jgi:two-component system, response regulator FlrC
MDSKRAMDANSIQDGATGESELAVAVKQLAGRLDLRSLERLFILQTLAAVNGSRKVAVARLGISERTLRNKLHLYRHSPLN